VSEWEGEWVDGSWGNESESEWGNQLLCELVSGWMRWWASIWASEWYIYIRLLINTFDMPKCLQDKQKNNNRNQK